MTSNETGRCLQPKIVNQMSGHIAYVASIDWAPDSRALAFAHQSYIFLLDTLTKEYIQVLGGHTAGITSINFSSDGKLLASGGADKTIRIWDVETGRTLKVFETGLDIVSMALQPKGELLALTSSDKKIQIWNVSTGEKEERLDYCAAPIRPGRERDCILKFSPDGHMLAWTDTDYDLLIWDIETGTKIFNCDRDPVPVLAIAFSPDSRSLAIYRLSEGFNFISMDIGTWQEKPIQRLYLDEYDGEEVTHMTYSPDGTMLACGGIFWGSSAAVFNPETGEAFKDFGMDGYARLGLSVVFSPNGKTLAVGLDGHQIELLDMKTGETRYMPIGHLDSIQSMTLSTDGKLFSSKRWHEVYDQELILWDMETGDQQTIATGEVIGIDAHGNALILKWTHEKSIEVEYVDGHENLRMVTMKFSEHGSVALSNSGKLIAWQEDRVVKIFDLDLGEIIEEIDVRGKFMQFSPDDTCLVLEGKEYINFWDIKSNKLVKTFDCCQRNRMALAFSPDGKLMASGSYEATIKVWDVATSKELYTFEQHTSCVSAVVFSPDSKFLVSGSYDQSVRFWDMKTGEEVCCLTGHSSTVQSILFTPDGQQLIVGTGHVDLQNTITVYQLY